MRKLEYPAFLAIAMMLGTAPLGAQLSITQTDQTGWSTMEINDATVSGANPSVFGGIDSLTTGGQAAFRRTAPYDNSVTQNGSFSISFVANFGGLTLDMSTPQTENVFPIFQHRIAQGNNTITQLALLANSWTGDFGFRMNNGVEWGDGTASRFDGTTNNTADVLNAGDLLFQITSSSAVSGTTWTNSSTLTVTRMFDDEVLFSGSSNSFDGASESYNPLTSTSHVFEFGYGVGRGNGTLTSASVHELSGSMSIGEFSVIPEPSTYALFFGALALAFVAYRRRKQ